ncbi:MAG: hypothetical protein RMK18_00905 [Armatimonadota bacterium]|nr:hypothetical protein [Armatimonadota bacterium]MCX7776900.1 hypothetical protein [Armatimonadota bacterium]MDW8024414.1 hypothetical protein [Armatimonadota bacterium]
MRWFIRARHTKPSKSSRCSKRSSGNDKLRDEAVLMQWSVHMARKRPIGSALVVVSIAITVGIGYMLLGSWFGGLIGGFVLTCALSDFLLPVRYRLTKRGAEALSMLYWRSIDWEHVRACYIDGDEIVLSPFDRWTPLVPFRSVRLRFNCNREEVIKLVSELAKWRTKG